MRARPASPRPRRVARLNQAHHGFSRLSSLFSCLSGVRKKDATASCRAYSVRGFLASSSVMIAPAADSRSHLGLNSHGMASILAASTCGGSSHRPSDESANTHSRDTRGGANSILEAGGTCAHHVGHGEPADGMRGQLDAHIPVPGQMEVRMMALRLGQLADGIQKRHRPAKAGVEPVTSGLATRMRFWDKGVEGERCGKSRGRWIETGQRTRQSFLR